MAMHAVTNDQGAPIKAVVRDEYGPPERLELRELEKPAVAADGVLVRVHASSVNPVDWHAMRGEPYVVRLMDGFLRPKESRLGTDLAGVVDAVGEAVTEFRPGDEVFGARTGAFADYVLGRPRNFVAKPAGVTFEQAAAIPVAGVTALQALRDRAQLRAGQRALINGAAGGVGTFAVQIAKTFGADVTGVCSTKNVDLVGSIGADDVVDYTAEDFTRNAQRYDLILDNVGNRSLRDLRRVLKSDGTLIIVGAQPGKLFRPLAGLFKALVVSPFVRQRLKSFIAKIGTDDLLVLKELVEDGKVTPVVDRTYPLSEIADAIRYLEAGHARGKVIITI
jgi:NADPH:quinone reductase-like Zn-dependent oxidoreductase